MLTLNVNSKLGVYDLNLPTSIDEITEDYINNVTSNIAIDANYTLVGVVYRERLSTLIIASNKNKKNSDIAVIPIFIKSGETNSELINSLKVHDKLIISPSDIMMGYHVSAPRNLLTINTILDIVDSDKSVYNKLLNVKEQCYFIEFKLVPNCNIHGAYKEFNDKFNNPFVIKKSDAPKSDIIIPNLISSFADLKV